MVRAKGGSAPIPAGRGNQRRGGGFFSCLGILGYLGRPAWKQHCRCGCYATTTPTFAIGQITRRLVDECKEPGVARLARRRATSPALGLRGSSRLSLLYPRGLAARGESTTKAQLPQAGRFPAAARPGFWLKALARLAQALRCARDAPLSFSGSWGARSAARRCCRLASQLTRVDRARPAIPLAQRWQRRQIRTLIAG